MKVIYQGIEMAQEAFKDIEKKIAIWVSNDPTMVIDETTFTPELILTYVPRWPLIINLLSACFCFGCSSIFHHFQITSPSVRSLLHRFDLGGICFLIMGSVYPLIMYPFAC
jgi:predicted membrane channel-forming protein YqfA (hemolysin III family)